MAKTTTVPCHILQEILEDGCCPLHLRSKLQRLMTDSSQTADESECCRGILEDLDDRCTLAITSFLPTAELLAARACSSELLHNAMRRPFEADFQGSIQSSSSSSPPHAPHAPSESPDLAPTRRITDQDTSGVVHDRIRVRLWLQQISQLTAGTADETVFETAVKNYVDSNMRQRLQGEVLAAKQGMAEEVRAAKASMLQCVQAISEEVDRRVHEKVTSLQAEFDKRVAEQDTALREMVERRVSFQTEAMRAEVDRRTDSVRHALESQAKVHEDVAVKLQGEVLSIREALTQQVHEQESTVRNLSTELCSLRNQFAEVNAVRAALEAKIVAQEEAVVELRTQLEAFEALYADPGKPADKPSGCFAWLRAFKPTGK